MTELWCKPDYQRMELGSECTAYSGTPDADEVNNRTIFTANDCPLADTKLLAAVDRADSDG